MVAFILVQKQQRYLGCQDTKQFQYNPSRGQEKVVSKLSSAFFGGVDAERKVYFLNLR